MREDGQGDRARPTLGLRRAVGQHESWGGSHGCWGGDREALTPETQEYWPLPAGQKMPIKSSFLYPNCYPGGKAGLGGCACLRFP